MIRIGTCGLLVLSCYFSVAQSDYREGYIVKVNGDSVSGWVKYPSHTKTLSSIAYRPTRKSISYSYSSEELVAFGFSNGRRYESKEIKDKEGPTRVFMRAMVKGPLSLYLSGNSIFVQKDTLFELPTPKKISSREEAVRYQHQKNRYIGLLTVLVYDCERMNANKTKFSISSIESLVRAYNKCSNLSYTVYEDQKRWLKVNGTFGAGVGYSNLSINTLGIPIDYNTVFSPQIFIGLQLNSPRLLDKYSFTTDLFLLKEDYTGFKKETGATTLRTDVDIRSVRFKIPLGIKYVFGQESSSFYLRAGVNFYYSIQSDLAVRQEEELANGLVRTVNVVNASVPLISKLDAWGSLGFSRSLVRNLRMSGEIRYESGLFRNELNLNLPFESNSLLFLLGINF